MSANIRNLSNIVSLVVAIAIISVGGWMIWKTVIEPTASKSSSEENIPAEKSPQISRLLSPEEATAKMQMEELAREVQSPDNEDRVAFEKMVKLLRENPKFRNSLYPIVDSSFQRAFPDSSKNVESEHLSIVTFAKRSGVTRAGLFLGLYKLNSSDSLETDSETLSEYFEPAAKEGINGAILVVLMNNFMHWEINHELISEPKEVLVYAENLLLNPQHLSDAALDLGSFSTAETSSRIEKSKEIVHVLSFMGAVAAHQLAVDYVETEVRNKVSEISDSHNPLLEKAGKKVEEVAVLADSKFANRSNAYKYSERARTLYKKFLKMQLSSNEDNGKGSKASILYVTLDDDQRINEPALQKTYSEESEKYFNYIVKNIEESEEDSERWFSFIEQVLSYSPSMNSENRFSEYISQKRIEKRVEELRQRQKEEAAAKKVEDARLEREREENEKAERQREANRKEQEWQNELQKRQTTSRNDRIDDFMEKYLPAVSGTHGNFSRFIHPDGVIYYGGELLSPEEASDNHFSNVQKNFLSRDYSKFGPGPNHSDDENWHYSVPILITGKMKDGSSFQVVQYTYYRFKIRDHLPLLVQEERLGQVSFHEKNHSINSPLKGYVLEGTKFWHSRLPEAPVWSAQKDTAVGYWPLQSPTGWSLVKISPPEGWFLIESGQIHELYEKNESGKILNRLTNEVFE